ncbi:outer membrane beta-barrel protein [Flavobacterium sp. I3-2]|uniref:outer membrane beta-barrel protein n=1 Tax=Flavobacterium sp. I3-2 TaxID=2748319 RepID=UPI0015A9DAD2|nr:outer membrane beta-barrel protein [Flavobacterium sp. I3-2]
MKKFIFLFTFLVAFVSNAQNIELKGKVITESKQPIEAVSVLLLQKKDSTVIQYAITDVIGNFSMKIKPMDQPSFLSLTYLGNEDKNIEFEKITESKDLGEITMKELSDMLAELVIVTDVPIRVKQDTLEFNASSFKVRPDANVEALLKELPGVEIDADKKITVNGQSVSQILVNGKPFFDKDGSVVLQNLPADIIKKIQVTDAKTKTEEFSGKRAKSENASINLTIDEKNNQGLFGKVMAGYGTDERYETSGLVNYFKGNRKISVLASSNNINSSGFSMDGVFDNMGGGRSQFNSFGGRSSGGLGSGTGSGITRTNMLGVNYSDQFFKDLEVNASYYLNDNRNENANRSRVVNLLPDGDFITESESNRTTDNLNHNANFNVEYKINPTTKIFIEPKISSSKNVIDSQSKSESMDANGDLFNTNNAVGHSETDTFNFSNSVQFNKVLDTNGKNLSMSFDNANSKTTGFGRTNSETIFYQGTETDDLRNQKNDTRSTNDNYTITATYTQPVAKNTELNLGYTFNYNQDTDVLTTYDFDPLTNEFSQISDLYSSSTNNKSVSSTPFVGVNYNTKKLFFDFKYGVQIDDFKASASYLNQEYVVNRKFVSPNISTRFRYKFTDSKTFNVNYNYSVTDPSATQILPYERFNDPLNTYIGNADLDQAKSHSINLSFRDFNFQMRSGWTIGVSGNFYDSQIVSTTVFDENRKRTTTYDNISGAYSLGLFGNFNKSKKIDAHTLRYGIGMRVNYGLSKGFTDNQLYENNSLTFTPRIYGSWDYGEFLTIAPSYSLGYTNNTYSNIALEKTSYVVHNINLQTTTYWPKNVTWGNDFGYTYNTNIAAGFKKDFFLWNTSLGYDFLNGALTAKVKVYDILNQNIGTRRTVSPTAISDQENTVLKRYAMFSLTFKFDKFGTGKQSNERGPGERGPRGDRPPGNRPPRDMRMM